VRSKPIHSQFNLCTQVPVKGNILKKNKNKKVCIKPPPSALNVTLPAFAAENRRACSTTPAAHLQLRSTSPARMALNSASKPACRCCWYRSIGHTVTFYTERTKYKVSLLIYKCLHQEAPLYLTEMCVPVSAVQRRHGLRSAVGGDLRSHDVIWQDTDKGASTSLDHHCGTLCR